MIQEAQLMPDIQLPRRVNFVLDEFANIPAIPDMDAMITAGKEQEYAVFLVVQSFHQHGKNCTEKMPGLLQATVKTGST